MPAPEARAKAIVARLSEGTASSDEVFAAFEELDHLPPEVVRGALEPWTGPAPDPERLDDHVRRAHRLPLRTPRLVQLESTRDADVLDLGDLAEQQLRIAGKTWDGQDLEAFDRLDGERDDSFAGALERRVLGESGRPVYDVFLFGEGSGVFFRAGTTTVLGVIADNRVETIDRPARAALEEALRNPPARVEHVAHVAHVERVEKEQLALPMLGVSAPTAKPKPKPEPEPADTEEEEAAPPPKKKKTAAAAPAAPEKPAPKKKAAAAAEKPAPKKKAAAAAEKPAPKKKKAAASPAKKKSTSKKKSAASDDE